MSGAMYDNIKAKDHNDNNYGSEQHWGGGPRVVVSTAPCPGLGGLKETKMFLPHPLVKLSIIPRGSVVDLRPTGFEFRIMCLISPCISPFSGGSLGPI